MNAAKRSPGSIGSGCFRAWSRTTSIQALAVALLVVFEVPGTP